MQIDRSLAARQQAFVERDPLPRAAALLRAACACALDQDLAHGVRRDGAEVRAVLPAPRLVLHQAKVGLVNERRRLQRLTGPLAAQIIGGEPPQLLIHDRQQRVHRLPVIGHQAIRLIVT